MGDSDVREHVGQGQRAGRQAFEPIASKLRRPLVRPEIVHRSSLIERLADGDPGPIVSVVAPAG